MKKFLVYIIIIIVLIIVVILLKNITTTKYSHTDIVALINKGTQSMDNMNNLSFDKQTQNGTTKYYFKNNKRKMISLDTNLTVIILEDGKTYTIDNKRKIMFTNTQNLLNMDTLIRKGLQDDALRIERLNNDVGNKDKLRYEFAYIKDEKIENKDCILVKERVFYLETKEYNDVYYNSKKETPVYWIEKSTGFVIGAALMEFGKNTTTPQTIIKNIQVGKVMDDVFNDMLELPVDYTILDNDGKIVKDK